MSEWHRRRAIQHQEPEMKLQLPDIRQQESYDCGAAAVDTAFRFLGVRSSAAFALANAVDGTHPATIEHALRRTGAKVQSGTMTLDDLRHHARQGRPVLCPVALFGGHWVTVAGVSRGRVYYQCPSEGARSLPVAAWMELWHDTTRIGHAFDSWGIAVGG